MTRKMTINVAKAQRGNVLFPAWECFVSSVGINNSPKGHFLRSLLLLLVMMTFGTNVSWGQETDYSGVYYIANNSSNSNRNYQGYDNASNYYLCPAHEYYDNGTIVTTLNYNDTPFLTTYQTRQKDESLWIVEKVENTNYYTFKQKFGDNDYRYLTVNDPIASLGKNHRRRVHLEQITEITDRNYFIIESIETVNGINSYAICCLEKYKGGNYKYLNPPNGNSNQYTASNNDSGGIIGFYQKMNGNNIETGSEWFFEVPKPIIHIDGNNKLSLTCANEDVTIHYTIDGEDPSATGTDDIYNTTDNIQLTEGVHTIKAIAVMNNGNVGYASGLITQEVTVFSTEHPYLISNNQNPWTIGSETKNIFYLIPSDNTTVNTTSMPRPTMEWNIRYTGETEGELYLNIINAKTGGYLYRTGDNIYMKTPSEKTSLENDGDNGFKFYLIKRTDGYSIVPYGITNKYLYKNGGNTDNKVVILNGTNNEYSQWNFATRDEVLNDGILPFTSSDANTSLYYKIQNGNGDNYFIIPPTTTIYATASDATDDATVKKMSWCFIKVEDPNDDDWLTYYKVVNAETGKALHYTGITNTSLNVGTYDDGDNNYKFAFVKSPTSNYYYIVPKSVKDDQLAQISMIWRDNNALKKGATRGVNNNIWKFTPADLFCNAPVFEKEAGPITISCVPDITRIYYTTDGTEPNPNDENQRYTNNTPFSASDQLLIKAIAFVSDGSNTASSTVITLLNKPDVTLEAGPYTYKGTAWEPSVTSVSIGETVAPMSPATYTVAYSSNNTDAGTANVTITDNDNTDAWYIWNVPVKEFTIDKAPLTIKANDKTIGYGDEPDNDGVTYNGFVGNPAETESVLGGTLSYSYTTSGDDPHPYTPYDPQYGNQGSYVITPSGLTSTNYDITFSTGVLTVGKKSIGDCALAEGFTLSFDEDGNVILNFGTHTLNKDVDYTIGNEVVGTKYSTRTLSGAGNYDGSVDIRNAIVHFTTDVNQADWSATFVAEKASATDIGHVLPEGMTAYIISGIEGTWAIPEPLGYIPAGVPVLLVTHEEKNGFLVKDAKTSEVTEITPTQKGYNKLKEVTDATPGYVTDTESENYQKALFNTKQIYVLYKNDFVLNKAGYLAKGKVYMDNPNYVAPSSSAPASLSIAWDNVTGIETVHGEGLMVNGQSDRWYTLDGRRLLGKPNVKGLYIVNGKKTVVK